MWTKNTDKSMFFQAGDNSMQQLCQEGCLCTAVNQVGRMKQSQEQARGRFYMKFGEWEGVSTVNEIIGGSLKYCECLNCADRHSSNSSVLLHSLFF